MDRISSMGGEVITEASLKQVLQSLPCGEVLFFDQLASTNDRARDLLLTGTPDATLVYAEQQTAGRGRQGRAWHSTRGHSLTFSLVLSLHPGNEMPVSLFSGLGAVAVCAALEELALQPQIKWPNDVLLHRRKVAGVLAEAVWVGQFARGIVLGIGVNVFPGSVPDQPALPFTGTCVQAETRQPVSRLHLLAKILQALFAFRGDLPGSMLPYWRDHLAFKGEQIELVPDGLPPCRGVIRGLADDGSLLLREPGGQVLSIPQGEVHLLPCL